MASHQRYVSENSGNPVAAASSWPAATDTVRSEHRTAACERVSIVYGWHQSRTPAIRRIGRLDGDHRPDDLGEEAVDQHHGADVRTERLGQIRVPVG